MEPRDDEKLGVEETDTECSSNELNQYDERNINKFILFELNSFAKTFKNEIPFSHNTKLYADRISFINPSVNEVKFNKCVEKTPSQSYEFPSAVAKVFRDVDRKTVCNIIREIMDLETQYWAEYNNLVVHKENSTNSMCADRLLQEYFKEHVTTMQYGHTYRNQILQYITEAALKIPSYGALIINSKQQIFAVQNHKGTWSAPKGHSELKANDEWETPKETCLREICEELKIKLINSNKTLTLHDIDQYFRLDTCLYLECFIKMNNNNCGRQVGLFVIHIDENKFNIELLDKKENQNCKWFELCTILEDMSRDKHDRYYTLRPFVEYLKRHPTLLQNEIRFGIE
ncbi:unnamed protein product [Adineta steineri]|uniref:Nudix hydrolase domain-containing protein n=1 Tax=Adineta steineri TaxID=433720 RepID=A0A815FDF1_9BILA|nr:unnamed protein product [Adineta steineri]CAF1586033.1 unnamed protein product [Adineta steineri]